MAFIQIIEHSDATGLLKETYDIIAETRGKLAGVHKIQSLNPESIIRHMDFYLAIMYSKSPLTRAQREMLAVVVSVTNNCVYCRQHHAEALNHYWKDKDKLLRFITNYATVELQQIELLLCRYAEQLTRFPSASTEEIIKAMKAVGLNDRAILDATLVIGYFNFVNRMVLGLGVELEADGGTGYSY